MMPELGKYAATVLSSYAISLTLLIGLVALSLWQGAKVRKQLKQIEERRKSNG